MLTQTLIYGKFWPGIELNVNETADVLKTKMIKILYLRQKRNLRTQFVTDSCIS